LRDCSAMSTSERMTTPGVITGLFNYRHLDEPDLFWG
jgi:hypothetical protein